MDELQLLNNSTLHEAIIKAFLTLQRPPTTHELATTFQRDRSIVQQSLRALAAQHGVVLHPHTTEIWAAHPFSATPTPCIVSAGSRKWWGNCAWCSLGIMHLATRPGQPSTTAVFETRLGALGDPVSIRVRDGELLDKHYVVHFPVPMQRAWDNVVYTCSVQLLFRDEADVDRWCAERGVDKGDVRPLDQVWQFAREWYGRHADPDWTKVSARKAREIFVRHGLEGPIWELGGDGDGDGDEDDVRF